MHVGKVKLLSIHYKYVEWNEMAKMVVSGLVGSDQATTYDVGYATVYEFGYKQTFFDINQNQFKKFIRSKT